MYYRAPGDTKIRNSASLIAPMIDVRGSGGYVLGQCSTVGGRAYEALDADDPAPLPPWIARLLTRRPVPPASTESIRHGSTSGRLAGLLRTVETAPVGQRNAALYWAANRARELVAAGELGADGAAAFLCASAVAAGLPEREAARTVASAMRGDAQ